MTGGGAIGSEAISAASLRHLASEWAGPRPAGAGSRSGDRVARGGGAEPVRGDQRTVRPRR